MKGLAALHGTVVGKWKEGLPLCMCARVFVRLFVCMCGLDEVKCERKEETAQSVSE